jgi:hypothetical protein
MGVTFKTVASGIMTPISFPSIISGLYPSHHGVFDFFSDWLINDPETLLNLEGYHSSLWAENNWTGYHPPPSAPIYNVVGCKQRVSLKELKTPFIYLEDEKGGHCPYGWSLTNNEYDESDCTRFFSDFGRKDVKELRKKYRTGAQRSLNEFQNRLKIIENRGLWDETLVIFLSDHGELLGEYGGIVGHESFTSPEVVYVPVVFIHPDLPKGLTGEQEGVLRHVDLYPTICSIIGRNPPEVDGLSLTEMETMPEFGFSYFVENITVRSAPLGRKRKYTFEGIGLWDKNGGHVFRVGMSPYQMLLRAVYVTVRSKRPHCSTAIYQRQRLQHFPWTFKDYIKVVNYYCKPHVKYGFPSLKEKEARLVVGKAIVDDEKFREKQRIIKIIRGMNTER